jgi:hypothetical protein
VVDSSDDVVDSSDDDAEISDVEVCSWPGGVNNHLQMESELLEENCEDLSAVTEVEKLDESNENDGQSEEEDEDLCDQEGEELRNSLEECIIQEARANINAWQPTHLVWMPEMLRNRSRTSALANTPLTDVFRRLLHANLILRLRLD